MLPGYYAAVGAGWLERGGVKVRYVERWVRLMWAMQCGVRATIVIHCVCCTLRMHGVFCVAARAGDREHPRRRRVRAKVAPGGAEGKAPQSLRGRRGGWWSC